MKRVTIEDVAKVAGVSRQTVSRAINNKPDISEETRSRVMEAVETLDYRPNRVARSMVTNRTNTVGFIIPDITNPFFPEVARGIQDAAKQMDYNVLFSNTDDSAQAEIDTLYSLAAQGVDGIMMFGNSSNEGALRLFADNYRPLLFVNRLFEHKNANCLLVDNERGAKLAISHLIGKGHQHIAMLTPENISLSQIRRGSGYQTTINEHGLETIIRGGQPTLLGGYAAAKQLLQEDERVSAVFTYNDLMAIGAIRACRDLGKRVPEDVAIIGFDDIDLATMVSPSLSSIRVDKYALGQKMMSMLTNMIQNPDKSFAITHFDIKLVVREST